MIGERLPIPLASAQNAIDGEPAALASVENKMKSRSVARKIHQTSKHHRCNTQLLQRQDAFGLGEDRLSRIHENDDVFAPLSFSLSWLLDDDSVPDFAIAPSSKPTFHDYEETDEDDTSTWYSTSDSEADEVIDDGLSIRGLCFAQDNETSSITDQRSQHKRVTFGNISIREYACTVGDHPLCTDSCPISLDWNYYAHEFPISISSFPKQNISHTKSHNHHGLVRRLTYEERYCRALRFDGYSTR